MRTVKHEPKRYHVLKGGKMIVSAIPGKFAGCRSTGIFGKVYNACKYGFEMNPANRVFFHSLEDAIREGYRPCKACRPVSAADFDAVKPLVPFVTLKEFYDAKPTRKTPLSFAYPKFSVEDDPVEKDKAVGKMRQLRVKPVPLIPRTVADVTDLPPQLLEALKLSADDYSAKGVLVVPVSELGKWHTMCGNTIETCPVCHERHQRSLSSGTVNFLMKNSALPYVVAATMGEIEHNTINYLAVKWKRNTVRNSASLAEMADLRADDPRGNWNSFESE